MTAGTTAINGVRAHALKGMEWMAENAYIAPGFHRLLTAGGLTLGLLGGRHFMDVLTARDAATGEETQPKHVTEIIRPIHGVMRYNPYSDAPADRWKFVLDRALPVAIGAFGAYWGGKTFFHGKIPGREYFSPATAAAKEAFAKAPSMDTLDTLLGVSQADATRKWAAGVFGVGSPAGMHLPGALWPFNNGIIAVSFQQGARRATSIPFLGPVNRFFGNFGSSSRYSQAAQAYTAKWMEANVVKFGQAADWAHEEKLINLAKDGLQKFQTRTPEQEKILAGAYRSLIDDAYTFKAEYMARHPKATEDVIKSEVYKFVSGAHNPKRGVMQQSFLHLLHDHGFDLQNAKHANDKWAFFSRLFGSVKEEKQHLTTYAKYLEQNFYKQASPEAAAEWVDSWVKNQLHHEPWKVTATYGGGAAALGVGLLGAGVVGAKVRKQSSHTHKGKHENSTLHSHHLQADSPENSPNPAPQKEGNIVDWINGKPLDVAHWTARVLISPPSMHRFMNAAYLSGVLYGGMQIANVLTGRKLTKVMSGKLIEGVSESKLLKEHVWAPFRPLHGLLEYTPGSAAIKDRVRQAAHFIMPVSVGMFGTYTGSHMYFRDRIKQLEKPDTLEDYADRIAMEQSKFYAGATALTSIFNTGSGIHLLPVFNYSSNLHNRYLMGSGQQVAMPGIGKWWSGNAGTTPWGVKRSLQFMTNYLTYNPSARPEEMPALVHSVIGKLYPNLNEETLLDKKQIMLDRIYDVRDSYLNNGTIPQAKRKQLGEVMGKLLSGVGFEALLREAELDPAKADLASNGMSGKIANFFGQKSDVEKFTREYREKFAARMKSEPPASSANFLKTLLDKGPANDSSFAERVKTSVPKEAELLRA